MKDQTSKEAFWRGVQEDIARLQADPKAWQGYIDEAALWDASASDGLENEDPYYSPEEEAQVEAEQLSSDIGDES